MPENEPKKVAGQSGESVDALSVAFLIQWALLPEGGRVVFFSFKQLPDGLHLES
jgi:hypothetical protein